MHQIIAKTAPSLFLSEFKKPSHFYPTGFSKVNFIKPTYKIINVSSEFQLEDLIYEMNFKIKLKKKYNVHPVLRQ